MMGESTGVIPAKIKKPDDSKFLSALQFKKGVKRQEPSYVTFCMAKEDLKDGNVPAVIEDVL